MINPANVPGLTSTKTYGTLKMWSVEKLLGGLKMIKNLATKAKSKLKYMRFKTYRNLKMAAHSLKAFLYDPSDSAPGDDFPAGPLMFLLPKGK